MQDIIRSEASKTMTICIDSYKDGVPVGRFYNWSQSDSCCEFSSMSQLLVSVEHLLNSTNYPQAYTAIRSFSPITHPNTGHSLQPGQKHGALGTFVVKILFRQHTSWQGSIMWMDEKCEQTFRSVLELILLMDSALNSALEKSETGCA